MTAYEQMVAEFNRRADKAVYYKGEQLLEKRLAHVPDEDYEEVIKDLTWCAYYNDRGSSEFGELTVEEAYYLAVENLGYDEGDELLRDYHYYEDDEEAVA